MRRLDASRARFEAERAEAEREAAAQAQRLQRATAAADEAETRERVLVALVQDVVNKQAARLGRELAESARLEEERLLGQAKARVDTEERRLLAQLENQRKRLQRLRDLADDEAERLRRVQDEGSRGPARKRLRRGD
ncbi:hypothetical protein MNEG_4559 [Monoraphidium neglectum]|uniref:Uncharacterized protein n=1 Tax=Monoraphidium neglectum TaxID=145388 RepID=A0A0D2L970_9CHLO|nr:hypothetical protein MNEG_4559 [Monoraphidium neglectum]KIZ03399.1 hypothetical protein MNEG_4559 [Monoraphidium neglectum]|eukprot:XP_013902418.1 hypothetical protein MNEG_4559 [Monoraphidium neglectum]